MKNFNYNLIYDFCRVKNERPASGNGVKELPPRVRFIIGVLKSYRLHYQLDSYYSSGNLLYNIYLLSRGGSNDWLMAHHDVLRPEYDNANDNSASVINAIAAKILNPSINVALVDSEEVWDVKKGSQRFSELVLDGVLKANSVLNLELTGKGGRNFFVGNYQTPLTKKIIDMFGCDSIDVPFNDAVVLERNGINTALINPLPLKEPNSNLDGKFPRIHQLDTSILNRCHTKEDSLENIDPVEMKEFVENVLLEIH